MNEPRCTRPCCVPTTHERELLSMLADGLTNRQIAERCVLSADAIKKQLDVLREKLGVPNRSAAVAVAIRERYIS